MQNIYNEFLAIKKKQMYNNFVMNKYKKEKKYNRQIQKQNNNETIYFNKIDKVYNLSILHSKINWFKYFLEKNIVELLQKYNNIKSNKIDLK